MSQSLQQQVIKQRAALQRQ